MLLTVGWSVLQLGVLMPVANHVTGSHQDMTVFADLAGNTTLLLGLLLASWTWVRTRYDSVWAAVLAHGFNNTLGLVTFYLVGPLYGLW